MKKIFLTKNSNNGMSMLEIAVVVAVVALLAAVILPQFNKVRERQVLKTAVSDILSSLNKAQTQTRASVDSSSYGVRFEESRIIIFKGTSYSESSSTNQIVSLSSPATITNVTLAGSSGESGSLYFSRLSGSPSKAGTVSVGTPNFSKVITISAAGAFSSN